MNISWTVICYVVEFLQIFSLIWIQVFNNELLLWKISYLSVCVKVWVKIAFFKWLKSYLSCLVVYPDDCLRWIQDLLDSYHVGCPSGLCLGSSSFYHIRTLQTFLFPRHSATGRLFADEYVHGPPSSQFLHASIIDLLSKELNISFGCPEIDSFWTPIKPNSFCLAHPNNNRQISQAENNPS